MEKEKAFLAKEKITSFDSFFPIMHEQLAAGQSVRFAPRGISMLPMLRQGKDCVVISPMTGKLKKYDIPLYRRENGQYVLHRIVEVGDTYTCMGDNQFVKEPGLSQEQMLAVVTSFYRGKREYKTTNIFYQIYCRLWYHSRFVRHFVYRALRWLRRHIK